MDQSRHPAGTPDGGRFAPDARPRSGISLDTDPDRQVYDQFLVPRADRIGELVLGPLTPDEEATLAGVGIEVTDELRDAVEKYFAGDSAPLLDHPAPALHAASKIKQQRWSDCVSGVAQDPLVRARAELEAPLYRFERQVIGGDAGVPAELSDAAARYLATGQMPPGVPLSYASSIRTIGRMRLRRLEKSDPEAYAAYAEHAYQASPLGRSRAVLNAPLTEQEAADISGNVDAAQQYFVHEVMPAGVSLADSGAIKRIARLRAAELAASDPDAWTAHRHFVDPSGSDESKWVDVLRPVPRRRRLAGLRDLLRG